jgi:hypothetical protein
LSNSFFDEEDIVEKSASSFFDEEDRSGESEKKLPNVDMGEALGQGIKQGATLGAADEGAGAVQALLDALMKGTHAVGLTGPSPSQVSAELAEQKITGDIGPASTYDLYRDVQQEEQDLYKAAKEQHPKTTMAGEFLGGMAIPGFGGGKAAVTGAKAATKAAQTAKAAKAADIGVDASKALAPLTPKGLGPVGAVGATTGKTVSKEAAEEIMKKAPTMGGEFGAKELAKSAAKVGAGMGAATGLATSESTIEDPLGLMADTGIGAGIGGVTAPLIPVGMKALGKVGSFFTIKPAKFLDEKLLGGRFSKGYGLGKKRAEAGKKVFGDEVKKEIAQKQTDLGEEFGEKLFQTGSELAKKKRNVIVEKGKTPLGARDEVRMLQTNLKDIMANTNKPTQIKSEIRNVKGIIDNTLKRKFKELPRQTRIELIDALNSNQITKEKLNDELLSYLSLRDLQQLKTDISEDLLGDMTKGIPAKIKSSDVNIVVSDFLKGIDNRLKTIPEIADINKKLDAYQKHLRTVGLDPANQGRIEEKDVVRMSEVINGLFEKTLRNDKNARLAERQLESLDNALRKVEKTKNFEPIINKLKVIAEEADIIGRTTREGELQRLDKYAATRMPSTIGSGIGAGVGTVNRILSSPSKLASKLEGIAKKDPKSLIQMGQIMASKLGDKGVRLADKLYAASEAPVRRRQAILFTLLQNPTYREMFETVGDDIGSFFEGSEGNNE